jgi:hypothetical protein
MTDKLRILGSNLGILDSPNRAAYRAEQHNIAWKLYVHEHAGTDFPDDVISDPSEVTRLTNKAKKMDKHLYPSKYGISGPQKAMLIAELNSEGAKLIEKAKTKFKYIRGKSIDSQEAELAERELAERELAASAASAESASTESASGDTNKLGGRKYRKMKSRVRKSRRRKYIKRKKTNQRR